MFRMPAEWEKQARVWLAWPHNKADWPDRFGPIPWAYTDFIRLLAPQVRVGLLVRNDAQQDEAVSHLERAAVDLDRVDFLTVRTNRIWLRDSGPIFVMDGTQKRALDWKFNAWAKYPNHRLDDKVPEAIASWGSMERVQPSLEVGGFLRRVVLEGGSIDVNGQGTLLTTEECLLSDIQCRNPGFGREDYERAFAEFLGIRNVIWLGDGIVGDDTHGHVDDLARFVANDTVVTVVESHQSDPNYALLQDNLKRLKAARDQDGKPLRVVELPMPRPVVFEGERLPASYANFLITNGLVLVPTFNDPADRRALSILAELFPDREVVGLHCGDFIWGLGTLHCASQQEPA